MNHTRPYPGTLPLTFSQRGLHDINNQLVFKSNPQFIFHDSRGFESGSLREAETVNSFITERAKSTDLPSQLHAIWCGINHMIFRQAQKVNHRYCLPTDTNRPLLDADRDFFSKYGGGKSQWAYLFFLHVNFLSFSVPYQSTCDRNLHKVRRAYHDGIQ